MQRFTRLFLELDASTRTTDKVAALAAYFSTAPAEDAAWALRFLTGRRPARAVSGRLLLAWAGEAAGLPGWLVEECYHRVGDLAEAVALLLPGGEASAPIALHRLVEERLLALAGRAEDERRALVEAAWRELGQRERLVYHKLLTGEFRLGVAKSLVVRALSTVAGLPPPILAHRLLGDWQPSAAGFANLIAPDAGHAADPGRPYPFCLAHPLPTGSDARGALAALGERAEWQAEWKWDGIRAQLIRRGGDTALWSRGEESVTEQFPELALAAAPLPDGTVLDGEILAWEGDRPRPFAALQRRLGRLQVSARMQQEVPLLYMAYDLLEAGGADLRAQPLAARRAALERLLADQDPRRLRCSPALAEPSWEGLAAQRACARALGVEGLMLKRLSSPYRVGRVVGDWWKWKVDPHRLDAVLVYAQYGHGQRAGLYTDYTFAVWDQGALVPIAKAYSGLTAAEIREVDRFVRAHTTEKFGPVRQVEPRLVFELAFEGIQASKRHKAGVALRFPRMARWRHDKPAAEADTLASVRGLLTAEADAAASSAAPDRPADRT
jgi:DNA ligase-1